MNVMARFLFAPVLAMTVQSTARADDAAVATPPSACAQGWEEGVAKTRRASTVKIVPSARPVTRLGSGFVAFDRRHVVTAWHVVDGQEATYDVLFPDGTQRIGKTVAFDEPGDVAQVELDADAPAPPIDLALDDPELGAPVIGIGSPLGIPAARKEKNPAFDDLWSFSVSRGIVSAVGARALQTDVPGLAPGASGGPLLNCHGELVGVLTAVEDPPWNNLVFASRSKLLPALREIPPGPGPRKKRTYVIVSALSASMQFGSDVTYTGVVLRPGFGALGGQLRLVGEAGLLLNGTNPSNTESVVGFRRRIYGSLGVGAYPKLWKNPSWIQPGLTLGASVMGDHYSTEGYRLDRASPDGISRVDGSSTQVSYRPFGTLDLRLGPFIASYSFHWETSRVQSSIHGVSLGYAILGW